MTFFLTLDNLQKSTPRFVGLLTGLILNVVLQTNLLALLPPIPIPPGVELTGNPLRVDEYIDSLNVFPGSDLAHVIDLLPIDGENFVTALDRLHPALLQDLTFATDENMQAVRQIFTGRNAFLRHGRCLKFEGLFSDHCNIGPSQLWATPFGVFNNQAHLGDYKLHGYRSTTPGMMIGIDSQPNKTTVFGVAAGYSWTDLHWKKKYGNADVHTGYLGAYAAKVYDNFYIDAAFVGSYAFYKTKRVIEFYKLEDRLDDFYCNDEHCCDGDLRCCEDDPEIPLVTRRLEHHHRSPCEEIDRNPRNRFRGYAMLSHVGFGWNFNFCGLHLIPFASLDYDFVDQDGHREYKGRSLNLRVKANHAHLLRTECGLSATGCIPYNCAWFRPSVTCSFITKAVLQGEKFRYNYVNYPDSRTEARGTGKTLNLIAPGFGLEVQTSYQYIFAFNYDAELEKRHVTQRATLRFQRMY